MVLEHTKAELTAQSAKDAAQIAPTPDQPPATTLDYTDRFLTEAQVLGRVPVSRRTWHTWRGKGWVPYIRLGRRVLYDWGAVRQALLRRQRGE